MIELTVYETNILLFGLGLGFIAGVFWGWVFTMRHYELKKKCVIPKQGEHK